MIRINHWEQLLGLTIDEVVIYPDRTEVEMWLDGKVMFVEFDQADTSDPFGINFYEAGSELRPADRIDPNEAMVGREILKIIVPFVRSGYVDKHYVTFVLSGSGNDIAMATEAFTPIRIS